MVAYGHFVSFVKINNPVGFLNRSIMIRINDNGMNFMYEKQANCIMAMMIYAQILFPCAYCSCDSRCANGWTTVSL